MSWRTALALWALAAGCATEAAPPGDEVLGSFGFSATPLELACGLDQLSFVPLGFEATLTRDSATGRAWLTMSRTSRGASWDGQLFTSLAAAPRVFTGCEACQTTLEERFQVALLSQSQAKALGGGCPPDALDGGVPAPDPDAGLTGPAMTPTGFDAARACGTLSAVMHSQSLPDAGECPAACDGCSVLFGLEGPRR